MDNFVFYAIFIVLLWFVGLGVIRCAEGVDRHPTAEQIVTVTEACDSVNMQVSLGPSGTIVCRPLENKKEEK